MLAFKLSSHKVQSVWQQLQSTYLSQGSMYLLCICPSPHDYIRSRFHKQLQQPKQRKSYLTCLWHCNNCSNSGQRKTWKQTHNKVSCFVSKYSSKQFPLPTQFRPFPLTYSNTCSTQTLPQLQSKPRMLPDASEKSRSTFPNRRCPHVTFLSLRCQPTISTPSSTVPSVPWRFLFISLFLSTPVPILPGKQQCFRLQSQGYQSVQTSVKLHCSCTLPNLRCSTTQVLSHKCGN